MFHESELGRDSCQLDLCSIKREFGTKSWENDLLSCYTYLRKRNVLTMSPSILAGEVVLEYTWLIFSSEVIIRDMNDDNIFRQSE